MLEQTRRLKAPPSAKAPPPPRRQLPRLPPYARDLYDKLGVPRQDWRQPSGRIIAFAHSLIVPAGKMIGKPLRLRPFQMDFIRDVYNPCDEAGRRLRRQAVLSLARRGGKTLLAALIVLVHLVGPAKRRNTTIVSAATTRKQASIVYRFVVSMIRLNATLRNNLKIIDSTKHIAHRRDNSIYSAISAEAGGQYGEGLDLVVYDELAQARNASLYDALMTSLGSQVDPLMMIISTQAPADDHILSELIDYGGRVKSGEIDDPAFTVHLYAAAPDCDILDEREWHRANPALGDYRDIDEFRSTMRRAVKVPSLEATVRNLYLNQRVQAKAPFLTPSVWQAGNTAVDMSLFVSGRPVFGGLDLSSRADLSAFVMAVEDDAGRIHLAPRVWTPADNLGQRAARDRAQYPAWAKDDLIIPVPGSVLDYDFLVKDVGDLTAGIAFQRMAFDRWRIDVFKQSMSRLGVFVDMMAIGQGYKDMAPALDIFEELALAGRIVHGGNPVLRWCLGNTIISMDAAGNRKLDKARSFGRIDAAVAAVMAVAAMKLQTTPMLNIDTIVC